MEKWKPVRNWKGWYEVSDQGRVRSVTRRSTAGAKNNAIYEGKILRACAIKSGYKTVSLTAPGVREYHYVHRLVLDAFVGQCPKGKEACHNDGTRDNNKLKNLRYDTRRANSLDRHKHGTMPTEGLSGEANGCAKLDAKAVRYIRARPKVVLRVLAEKFSVTISAIWCVRFRKTWTHI